MANSVRAILLSFLLLSTAMEAGCSTIQSNSPTGLGISPPIIEQPSVDQLERLKYDLSQISISDLKSFP